MNKNYQEYSFEDFSRDESFRQWVLNPDDKNDELWKKWVFENPDCAENIKIAKAFLLTLHEKDILLNNKIETPSTLISAFNSFDK